MKLSKECIEAIEKECHDGYGDTFHYQSTVEAMEEALTNPSIYSKAGLISLEDAFGFAEMYYTSRTLSQSQLGEPKTTAQLFQIYQEQKEK